MRDDQGHWVFILAANQDIQSRRLLRPEPTAVELPLGHIERTQFYIYKLQYRNGEQIQDALKRIAESLFTSGLTNEELINAINSAQWLAATNSIVFTGTNDALRKVRELVEELDKPLRQIFLDMLIMQIGVDDSLEYGVTWASAFGNPNSAGAQTFNNGATDPIAMITGIVNGAVTSPLPTSGIANPPLSGYTLGVVGQSITHNGTSFGSISAIVRAQHDNTSAEVLMNPKVLTEDNATAEIFVGITQPFKTQSIANDQGSTITTSFDFRDVGTSLKVTPIIGDNDVITLEIHQEVSQAEPTAGATGNVNVDPPPTISKITATTRVHVPNNYFLVLSGMIQDTLTLTRSQVPCLGGVPVIGALFSRKLNSDSKRNLMIFINPRIIDTYEDMQNITKHEQDIYRIKKQRKGGWRFEVDEALDFLNIKSLDETSFHDKRLAPSCTAAPAEVDEGEEDTYSPCDEIGSPVWRDNKRLYR
jgi:type III secretion protein C